MIWRSYSSNFRLGSGLLDVVFFEEIFSSHFFVVHAIATLTHVNTVVAIVTEHVSTWSTSWVICVVIAQLYRPTLADKYTLKSEQGNHACQKNPQSGSDSTNLWRIGPMNCQDSHFHRNLSWIHQFHRTKFRQCRIRMSWLIRSTKTNDRKRGGVITNADRPLNGGQTIDAISSDAKEKLGDIANVGLKIDSILPKKSS